MKDQATQLRQMVRRSPDRSGRVRTIAVSSGKGGVGKTSICANLGCMLASMRKRVLIIDADMGLANVDVIFGIHPKYTLNHVLEGSAALSDIIINGPGGIKIIPGASGVQALADLPHEKRNKLITDLSALQESVDFLLIDTAAGISKNVTEFIAAAGELLVITTPEPTAITDAYALIKVMLGVCRSLVVKVFINQAQSVEEARDVDEKLQLVTHRFLGKKIKSIGFMQKDTIVTDAVRKQEPFVLYNHRCQATTAIRMLAQQLCNGDVSSDNTLFDFAQRLMGNGQQ